MSYLANIPAERTVLLKSLGIPVTSLTYTDVVVQIKKDGDIGFSIKTLAPTDWLELGDGLYTLKFSAADMSVAGNFLYRITGGTYDPLEYEEFQILPSANPIVEDVCIVRGSFKNYSVSTSSLLKVVARPVQFPANYGQDILAADQMFTFVDSFGNFSLPLVRNSIVVIEVERAGIRHQITVPDADTADLKDLLPPFAVDFTI